MKWLVIFILFFLIADMREDVDKLKLDLTTTNKVVQEMQKADIEVTKEEPTNLPEVTTKDLDGTDKSEDTYWIITGIKELTAEAATQYARENKTIGVNANQMVELAKCESTFREKIISPNGKYYGMYQWRPSDIPGGETCALDFSCSTYATIDAITKGETWRWPTCWDRVKDL